MTKLRKQRRRKVFRHNVNRKRLRNKIYSVGNIGCKEIKNAWEQKKSVETNLIEMGLSYDPNKTIKIPHSRKVVKPPKASYEEDNDWLVERIEKEELVDTDKLQVAETLEADAKAPRKRLLRLPKSQIEWLTYLMVKYGSDYKAMARDKKNYNQETWKQIRGKIKLFKSIPEQFNKFLEENSLESSKFDDVAMSDDEI